MEFSKEAGLAVPLEIGKMLLTVVGSASIQGLTGCCYSQDVTTLAATADIEDVNGMASMLTRLYRLCVTDTDLKLMADDYTAVVEGLAGGASVPVYQDASTLDMFNIVSKPEFQLKHGRLGSEGSEAQSPMQLDQGKGRGGIHVQEIFNVLLLLLMDNILGNHVKQASAGLMVCGLGVLMPVMIVR
eukprot:gene1498-1836_t